MEKEIRNLGKNIKNAKIGILGLAYKKNVDDIRESPSLAIIDLLKKKKTNLFIYDPFVKKLSNTKDLNALMSKSDYIIIATDHDEFKNIDVKKFKQNNIKVIIDGMNCLNKERIKKQRDCHI